MVYCRRPSFPDFVDVVSIGHPEPQKPFEPKDWTDLSEFEILDRPYSNYGPSLFPSPLVFWVAPDGPQLALTDLICFGHLWNFLYQNFSSKKFSSHEIFWNSRNVPCSKGIFKFLKCPWCVCWYFQCISCNRDFPGSTSKWDWARFGPMKLSVLNWICWNRESSLFWGRDTVRHRTRSSYCHILWWSAISIVRKIFATNRCWLKIF